MQTIRAPLIGVLESGVALVTAAVWLIAVATGTVTENTEPPLVQKARDYIDRHKMEPLPLAEVAKAAQRKAKSEDYLQLHASFLLWFQ